MSRLPRKAAIGFILITVFIDVLGIGIIIPILPELIKQFVGGTTATAGRYYGLISASYALMQFVFAPVLGALSDRFGRRPIILASLFGLGIDYLVMAFAPTIAWIIVGRLFAGVMGASFTTANAYIADISGPEDRARNFGLVGVAFGVGFIVGPAMGGILGGIDIRLPFLVAAGLALVNWLYGFFVLPESLSLENRDSFHWKRANPLGSLAVLKKYPIVAGLASAFIFLAMAQRGLENSWILYCGHRFGWDERTNALTLALVGLMAVVVHGTLVKPIIHKLGERRAILGGLAISSVTFLLYGLANQGWMMFAIIVFGAIGGVAGPALQGLVAGSVGPSDQGKVQGGLTSLMSLTSIVAPIVFTAGLFAYFTSEDAFAQIPGAPFFLGSLFFVIALAMLVRLFRRIPEKEPSETEEPVAPV